MLEIRNMRSDPSALREMLKRRNSEAPLDILIKCDEEWRRLKQKADTLRAERNRASIEIANMKKGGEDPAREISKMKKHIRDLDAVEKKVKAHEKEIAALALQFPNTPHDSVPPGKDEDDDVLIKTWGKPDKASVSPHWDIGKELGVLDFERGVKLAGSRFTVLRGWAARIERALINFMLDTHIKNGYTEISPPLLVNVKTMTGTGQLPKFEEELYKCERDGLYLIPTAEVPLVNLHSGEILSADELPISYVAYTPCFRREAGSYGKDIKGIMRQHQFDKVELVKITEPETSYAELERILADAESILQALELPYRVNELCAGELGFASSKTYDIEVWIPTQEKYREISSCSNCEAFQARRASIRYRVKGKPQYVHTLNGSGLAVGRTLIALMENHQKDDGTILVPKVLRAYMNGITEIKTGSVGKQE
ncbi:MAG: serine--tRNA ligase [Candidatus Micrarchaeota archaeon]